MSEKLVADVNGTKVWYEKVGDGDHVILLLPGVIGMSNDVWLSGVRALDT